MCSLVVELRMVRIYIAHSSPPPQISLHCIFPVWSDRLCCTLRYSILDTRSPSIPENIDYKNVATMLGKSIYKIGTCWDSLYKLNNLHIKENIWSKKWLLISYLGSVAKVNFIRRTVPIWVVWVKWITKSRNFRTWLVEV